MKRDVIKRLLSPGERSFFLFGPRGTGKSTWLRTLFPDACRLDLLDTALYYELQREPQRLEGLIGRRPENAWVVLDEIQKIPALLDEVHRLMADKGWRFALCVDRTQYPHRKKQKLPIDACYSTNKNYSH